MKRVFLSTLTALGLMTTGLLADLKQDQIVSTSTFILKVFNKDYDGTRPDYTLPKRFERKNINAVMIIPDLVKAGLVVTGQKGDGIFCIRNSDGSWSDPLFVTYTGFGVGVQAGYISNDAVMLFQNRRSYSALFEGDRTLEIGGNASINGGESRHHASDLPQLAANIFAVGRSDGVFLGMDISSARLKINDENNIDYYHRMYEDRDIVNGSPKDSRYTRELKRVLRATFDRR